MKTTELAGLRVLVLEADGPPVASEQDALDILGEAYGLDFDMLVVQVSRLPESFFRLSTGLAGAVLQKFTNYHLRVALVGDIASKIAASAPLRDFVRESNRRKQVVFAADEAELAAILS